MSTALAVMAGYLLLNAGIVALAFIFGRKPIDTTDGNHRARERAHARQEFGTCA